MTIEMIAQVAAVAVVGGITMFDELARRREKRLIPAAAPVTTGRCPLPQEFAESAGRWFTPKDGLAPRTSCRCADESELLRIAEIISSKVAARLKSEDSDA